MKVYIPRILGGVTQKMLMHTFERLSIGEVYYIDMHRKVNENNRVYYFAFLEIELYNTVAAKRVTDELNTNLSINLVYDEEAGYYWEVKKHIPKTERPNRSSVMPVAQEVYLNVASKCGFIEEAAAEPVKDFDYDAVYAVQEPYNMWDAKYILWQPNEGLMSL